MSLTNINNQSLSVVGGYNLFCNTLTCNKLNAGNINNGNGYTLLVMQGFGQIITSGTNSQTLIYGPTIYTDPEVNYDPISGIITIGSDGYYTISIDTILNGDGNSSTPTDYKRTHSLVVNGRRFARETGFTVHNGGIVGFNSCWCGFLIGGSIIVGQASNSDIVSITAYGTSNDTFNSCSLSILRVSPSSSL